MRTVRFVLAALVLSMVFGQVWSDGVGRTDKSEDPEKHQAASEVLAGAQINLLKAMEISQQKFPDGKMLRVRTERLAKPSYGCYFLVGGKIREVEIDTRTGETVKTGEKDTFNGKTVAEVKKALEGQKVSFVQAVEMATARIKDGKPFEVELELSEGNPVVEVELVAGKKITKVRIDAADASKINVKEDEKK